jgi:hypothetical protein
MLIYGLTSNLLAGQACARLIGMLYNYSVVKEWYFFRGRGEQNLPQISRSRHLFWLNFISSDQNPDTILAVARDRLCGPDGSARRLGGRDGTAHALLERAARQVFHHQVRGAILLTVISIVREHSKNVTATLDLLAEVKSRIDSLPPFYRKSIPPAEDDRMKKILASGKGTS